MSTKGNRFALEALLKRGEELFGGTGASHKAGIGDVERGNLGRTSGGALYIAPGGGRERVL